MKNYYEKKFEDFKKEFDTKTALLKTVQILLYHSNHRQPNDKYNIFWHSYFINDITENILKNEHFIWALGQHIRYGEIDQNLNLYSKLIELNEDSFISAIRLSGIIKNFQKDNLWDKLAIYLKNCKSNKLLDFLNYTNKLRKYYLKRKEEYSEIKIQLNLDQLEALIFTGLYLYQFVVGKTENITIPFQIKMGEFHDNLRNQDIWKAVDEIIQSALPVNSLTENKIPEIISNKISPLLSSSQNKKSTNKHYLYEYNLFCKLIANRVNLNIWKKEIITSYCYIHDNNEIQEDFFSEKRGIIQLYYDFYGVKLSNSIYKKEQIESIYKKFKHMGLQAFYKKNNIQIWQEYIYGITELSIDNNTYNLNDLIKTITSAQVLYQHEFIFPFLSLTKEGNLSPNEALLAMAHQGFLEKKIRTIIAWDNLEQKALSLYNWISDSDDGKNSKTQKTKKMIEILKFWSQDLDSPTHTDLSEKPFYKIRNYLFILPQCLGEQDLYTTAINSIRKTYKNRPELRKETSLIEQNLANLFKQYDFEVYHSFEPENNSSVGEMDLVVIQNNTVLLIELKSSFIRSEIDEIYQYKYFTLNKAAYQLDKKLTYLKKYYSDKQNFYSWIVDTTLEFDHEYFGSHLKISLEELIITLNGNQLFLKEIKNAYENPTSFKEIKSEIKDLNTLINQIQNNEFWKEALIQFQFMTEKYN